MQALCGGSVILISCRSLRELISRFINIDLVVNVVAKTFVRVKQGAINLVFPIIAAVVTNKHRRPLAVYLTLHVAAKFFCIE